MTKPKMARQVDAYGWEWREKRTAPGSRTWVKQKRFKVEVEPFGEPVEEYVERLRAAVSTNNLEEAVVDSDVVYGQWGDRDRDAIFVQGWKDATDEEIAEKEKELEEWRRRRDDNDRRQLEYLKRERPDLFK